MDVTYLQKHDLFLEVCLCQGSRVTFFSQQQTTFSPPCEGKQVVPKKYHRT